MTDYKDIKIDSIFKRLIDKKQTQANVELIEPKPPNRLDANPGPMRSRLLRPIGITRTTFGMMKCIDFFT